jgi:hypothetical protein
LSEYNSSLQDYNCKLQKDASSAVEENARTQREKLTILETLGAIRMSTSALQTKLETTKVRYKRLYNIQSCVMNYLVGYPDLYEV